MPVWQHPPSFRFRLAVGTCPTRRPLTYAGRRAAASRAHKRRVGACALRCSGYLTEACVQLRSCSTSAATVPLASSPPSPPWLKWVPLAALFVSTYSAVFATAVLYPCATRGGRPVVAQARSIHTESLSAGTRCSLTISRSWRSSSHREALRSDRLAVQLESRAQSVRLRKVPRCNASAEITR